jgi:hypothetical protein
VSQFVSQDAIDVLVDGELALQEMTSRIEECPEEDASALLLLDIAGMLLSDIAEGREVTDPSRPGPAGAPSGRTVTSLPRIDRLYGLARARVSGADRVLVQGSYDAIVADLEGSASALGVGLAALALGYARGLCYRSVPLPQGVADALDDFERLAERRQALGAVAGALPWLLGLGLVGVTAWMVFGKKR